MEIELKTKLENLPNQPGVYQFLDKNGKIIYVGKAKDLKKRVSSYFQSNISSPKTQILVSKINDLQVIVTKNEIEALVLENNLIKEIKPRYNVNLKDDKTFPYIRITNEPFPQVYPTRKIVRDGSKYFGPYTEAKNMKSALRLIFDIFKLRTCKLNLSSENILKDKYKVCLNYHIKKCYGPCEGLIGLDEYDNIVKEVIQILKGKTDDLLKKLNNEMLIASNNLEFEKATELRDKIQKLSIWTSRQNVVSKDECDKDIITIAVDGKDIACTILNILSGKLIGKKNFKFSMETNETEAEIFASIIRFYYNEFVEIPNEIILETEPTDTELLRNWLKEKSGKNINFIIPQRESEAKSLLNICKQNAILYLKEIQLQKMKKDGAPSYSLVSLKKDLNLKILPKKIECFDISHIQGSDTVASLVTFIDGKPKKSLYRKFIIKSVEKPDDFQSMREVVYRHYKRLIDENKNLPDLIIIDGGKGQLTAALSSLTELGITEINIVGLAKRLEEVYFHHQSEPIQIAKTSSSLKLIQKIRDEAHRFAITFHRLRRDKRTLTTELTEIKGIGKTIAEKLLNSFNSIEEVKNAEISELETIIGKAKAKKIKEYFS
ncbi:MAG: excinuclease ABC subunit C [Ignavibacteriales bacterium]|nr:excinuclease ABC subunit C [Ignavibacteriales bacterium]